MSREKFACTICELEGEQFLADNPESVLGHINEHHDLVTSKDLDA